MNSRLITIIRYPHWQDTPPSGTKVADHTPRSGEKESGGTTTLVAALRLRLHGKIRAAQERHALASTPRRRAIINAGIYDLRKQLLEMQS